jgi:hypothetical protein
MAVVSADSLGVAPVAASVEAAVVSGAVALPGGGDHDSFIAEPHLPAPVDDALAHQTMLST